MTEVITTVTPKIEDKRDAHTVSEELDNCEMLSAEDVVDSLVQSGDLIPVAPKPRVYRHIVGGRIYEEIFDDDYRSQKPFNLRYVQSILHRSYPELGEVEAEARAVMKKLYEMIAESLVRLDSVKNPK